MSGEGEVIDLSIRGGGIVSATVVLPGTTLELQIHESAQASPLTVAQAVVRWCHHGRFGLEFVSLQPGEWARLQSIVTALERHPYEQNQSSQDRAAI